MEVLRKEKEDILKGLKDKKSLSKKRKKQLKEVEKRLIATSLKLSVF